MVIVSGNRIGAEGINAFKKAIQYKDTILSETPKGQGTGLMRLIINVSSLSDSLKVVHSPRFTQLSW